MDTSSSRCAAARSFLFVPGNRPERFAKAVQLDGRMVDLPVVLQARRTLARATRT